MSLLPNACLLLSGESSMTVVIRKLLSRGDEICVERGRLVIRPVSGMPVPPDWFQEHSPAILREVLTTLGVEAYEYCRYTTGHYGLRKRPGLTLQFQSAITHEEAYAIFNVELTRSRSTGAGKRGAPLPTGHFRVGKRSHLYRFWRSTGLPEPKRLAALHDYMGNLRGIVFTAGRVESRKNRMSAGSLQPLSVSVLEVRRSFLPDNLRTTRGQTPDNIQTRVPDKDSAQALAVRGLQPKPITCYGDHGTAVISERGGKRGGSSPLSYKRPQDQTNDEWLADYSSPSDCMPREVSSGAEPASQHAAE